MANPLRKTLEYLGLAEEDVSAEQPAAPAAQHPVAPVASAAPRANVTQIRRNSAKTAGLEMNEILTVHPKKYADAQVIAESFRDGIPVIINLSQMSEPDARRLVDFASGLASGLYGKIERVTPKVFLLSPSHVVVSGDESAGDDDSAFFTES